MADVSIAMSRPQELSRNTTDDWIVIDKELPPSATWLDRPSSITLGVLKHSATMPLLGRSDASTAYTPLAFETVHTPLEVVKNGRSGLQWPKTTVSSLGTMIMNTVSSLGAMMKNHLPSLNPPQDRMMTFRPDIEVRSKRKSFGVKKWKEMRVVLDTGCTAGNWVSLSTLQRLGVEQYLPLDEDERNGVLAFGGATVTPCGAVNLTWRGITGRGPILNSSQNFKTRFLVVGNHCPAPFAILIGSNTIKEHRLLSSPLLIGAKRNSGRVVELPRKLKNQNANNGPTFDEKVMNNDKAKEARRQLRASNSGPNPSVSTINDYQGIEKDPSVNKNNSSILVQTCADTDNNPKLLSGLEDAIRGDPGEKKPTTIPKSQTARI